MSELVDQNLKASVGWWMILSAYVASLGVLILQLVVYGGSQTGYVLLLVLHAVTFWVLTLIIARRPMALWPWIMVIGGVVIGTMPYQPTLAALERLAHGEAPSLSSLTRNLPLSLRLVYELGLFPALQTALAALGAHFAKARR